jgi:hypothetical protein
MFFARPYECLIGFYKLVLAAARSVHRILDKQNVGGGLFCPLGPCMRRPEHDVIKCDWSDLQLMASQLADERLKEPVVIFTLRSAPDFGHCVLPDT